MLGPNCPAMPWCIWLPAGCAAGIPLPSATWLLGIATPSPMLVYDKCVMHACMVHITLVHTTSMPQQGGFQLVHTDGYMHALMFALRFCRKLPWTRLAGAVALLYPCC